MISESQVGSSLPADGMHPELQFQYKSNADLPATLMQALSRSRLLVVQELLNGPVGISNSSF